MERCLGWAEAGWYDPLYLFPFSCLNIFCTLFVTALPSTVCISTISQLAIGSSLAVFDSAGLGAL